MPFNFYENHDRRVVCQGLNVTKLNFKKLKCYHGFTMFKLSLVLEELNVIQIQGYLGSISAF